ncbi:hypothetical protein GNF10_31090 [Nostoc sp. UCD121]|uniref:hypothetical protein n=1 Tax=unclassified Nostoc TaxID=2593658 RepID=UPI00162377EA|nr:MULTISPECIES: hypothetical protein [unclassified Nostoc]MBC1225211.1 hypothetical protein [Nostoc sp. UCD120]MBC1280275.1 hypothetical protein [Nostoc sp. UCD121]MBC1299201.1 hypothetical protein [Nostoc sp. UCD122]
MPIRKLPANDQEYYLISFDAKGNERTDDPDGMMSQQIINVLSNEPITDVFLISHGWLGDVDSAIAQYDRWIGVTVEQSADIERMKQIRPGFLPLLIGVHWPSLPWGNEELKSISTSFEASAISPVEQLVDQYAERIADTETARGALRKIFSAAMDDIAPDELPSDVKEAYRVLNDEAAIGSEGVDAAPGSDREPFNPENIFEEAEAEDEVNFGNFSLGGLLAPLRMISFWKMKDRARKIGESGGFKLLTSMQDAASQSVRFHFMGHSFGCIVVSAILAGSNGKGTLARPVNSVVLVQGALSLWSYCSDIPDAPGRAGYFHPIIADQKVIGPIVTTHSQFDTAVGKMYPLGAGVAGQVEFPLKPGESPKLPKYGGLGAFGSRGKSLEIVDQEMLPLNTSYQFEAGKIYNLKSDKFISKSDGSLGGAHNDIARPEVSHAVWEAAMI